MSRIDEITGKKSMRGNLRSFAMNHSKREFNLNLQKATIKDGKGKRTVRVNARTLKTLKKNKMLVSKKKGNNN